MTVWLLESASTYEPYSTIDVFESTATGLRAARAFMRTFERRVGCPWKEDAYERRWSQWRLWRSGDDILRLRPVAVKR